MKKCNICLFEKEFNAFHKHSKRLDGYCETCKECRKAATKDYYKRNSEKIKKATNAYYHENKDSIRPKRREYQKKRLMEDPKTKLTRNLRNRLYYSLLKKVWKKDTHFYEYIGCSKEELQAHLEIQFQPGMSWENYNLHGWHIDHIIPLASAKTEEEMYKLCHYTNLQPMWAKENLSKGTKILNDVKKKS